MSNVIEHLRKKVIDDLFTLKSFGQNWDNSWKDAVRSKIQTGSTYDASKILDLPAPLIPTKTFNRSCNSSGKLLAPRKCSSVSLLIYMPTSLA